MEHARNSQYATLLSNGIVHHQHLRPHPTQLSAPISTRISVPTRISAPISAAREAREHAAQIKGNTNPKSKINTKINTKITNLRLCTSLQHIHTIPPLV
jgi:hypothetical protein